MSKVSLNYSVRRAVEADMSALIDLWSECLSAPREYFASRRIHDPAFKPSNVVIAAYQDSIIGSVGYFPHTMAMNGALVSVGGIGNVATNPAFRGYGIASKLMYAAEETMVSQGIEVGLLFTDIQPFYEKIGWRIFPMAEYSVPSASIELPGAIHEAAVTEKTVDSIADFYASRYVGINGAFSRSPELWKKQFKWISESGFSAVYNGSELAGYYRWRLDGNTMEAFEVVPRAEADLDAIILCMQNCAANAGADSVLFSYYKRASLNNPSVVDGCSEAVSDGMMIKILNKEKLAARFGEERDWQAYFIERPFIFLGADSF